MSDPLKENEVPARAIIKAAYIIFQDMLDTDSHLPHRHLEEKLLPRLLLSFVDVQIKEAKRCDSYRVIGSPRVIELEATRNELAFQVAKLDVEKRRL